MSRYEGSTLTKQKGKLSPSLSLWLDIQLSCFHATVMQETTDKIRDFLQFIALQFIEHPEQAQLRVAEVEGDRISFRLIVAQSDVPVLIGRNGFTASAIRNVLKAAASRDGVQASLHIYSHEEERQRMAEIEASEIIDDGSSENGPEPS